MDLIKSPVKVIAGFSAFHGHRIKLILSSHSSIPPSFISNEKYAIGRLIIS